MRIFQDFNAEEVSIPATTVATPSVSGPDILGDRVVAYHLQFKDGAGASTYGDITRIRVKAGGDSFIDVDREHFRAFVYRMSRSNYLIADADKVFTIPFYNMDAKGDDRYLTQFPRGKKPTIEIALDGTQGASTMIVGYSYVDKDGSHSMRFTGSSMNIAASQSNKRHNITEKGAIRGFSINTTGLDRAEIKFNGVKRLEINDQQLIAASLYEGKKSNESSNPQFFKLHGPDAQPGEVFVKSGATWAGIGNEFSVYSLESQG